MLYKVPLALWAQRSENLRSALSQCTCECLQPWKRQFSIFLPYKCPSLLFKKMSHEGRKQNKVFSYMNSVAGYESIYRSSGCQADLSILSNTSHSERGGVQGNHSLALCTEGAVFSKQQSEGGTKVSSRCWPKNMLWLQHFYSCFDADFIKTGPFTKDWGFYEVVEHDGNKPQRLLVYRLPLQQSFKQLKTV